MRDTSVTNRRIEDRFYAETVRGYPGTAGQCARLVVKRKFKTARNDQRVTKWWFVVRGDESVAKGMVSVQTSWRLVLSYGDDPVSPPNYTEKSEQPSLASSEQAVTQQTTTHHEPANPSLSASLTWRVFALVGPVYRILMSSLFSITMPGVCTPS